jgi:ubiquinone/menaquinone biosynthesis C-methylase UbiE
MPEVCWATPLYEFLRYCEKTQLPKDILDCGAGGEHPPLALFHRYGYTTAGIDHDPEALEKAAAFCEKTGIELGISEGDMREIPFPDGSFSFAYSYNAISFMTKPDIAIAVSEMERVLRPTGLCFVNFDSVDDPDRGEFTDSVFVREVLRSRRFSQFEDDEADIYFGGFTILNKQKRLIEKLHEGEKTKQAFIDYIARKDGAT